MNWISDWLHSASEEHIILMSFGIAAGVIFIVIVLGVYTKKGSSEQLQPGSRLRDNMKRMRKNAPFKDNRK